MELDNRSSLWSTEPGNSDNLEGSRWALSVSNKQLERRDAILRAARSAFVSKGFAAVSLDDIIRDVGGSRRNIYTLFGGKEDLFRAVVEEIIGEVVATAVVDVPDDSEDPREWLVALCRRHVGILCSEEMIAVTRQFIGFASGAPQASHELWSAGPGRFRGFLTDWLRRRHALGTLHVPDPESAAAMLPEMAKGSFQTELLFGMRSHVSSEELENHVRAAVDLFLDGLRPRR